MTLRLGLGLPQTGTYDMSRDVTAAARAAEESGYDSVWVLERLMRPEEPLDDMYLIPGARWADYFRSVADPLVTLSLAAAVTERVKLGSAVLVGTLHPPFLLARALGSLDAASGGRVIAGFGTGWSRDEYRAAGADHAGRGAALDELLDVCEAVWGPDPVPAYEGRNTRFPVSAVGPKPAARIPVLLAAGNERAQRRLVRRADGWLPSMVTNEQVAAGRARLAELAAEQGRDPSELSVTVRASVQLSEKPVDGARKTYQGSAEQIVEDLRGAAAGADEVLLDTQLTSRDVDELIEKGRLLVKAARDAGV
ncbi:LLM class F420-dependent oxidoreductase [Streptomyces albiaxialis]|uniref:LLM class F420-dependent oxidoreductase n=1 Tax=Streptomyces albiaxialis TaxID=329523 RepID=A0ABP5IMR6_9ACTN